MIEIEDRIPRIGEIAPSFESISTQGTINFPENYKGKWVVLFSYPSDFMATCTTELIAIQNKLEEFRMINTEVLAYSVDGVYSHIARIKSIKEHFNIDITFPVIDDLSLAMKFGMIHPKRNPNATVSSVFVIDPQWEIRNIFFYSQETGKSIDEVFRVVKALQVHAKSKRVTPADWPHNSLLEDKVIIPTLTNIDISKDENIETPTRYIRAEPYNPNL